MATLVDVIVLPLNPTVINGSSVQLQAVAVFDDDSEVDVTESATWASATPAHATVGAGDGLVTGVATGTSVISATFGGASGAQTVTSGRGAVVSVAITGTLSAVKGATSQLTATATYEDASTADVTSSAEWSSTNETAATVVAGLVTAVEVGTSDILATAGGHESPEAAFSVHNDLVSIALAPSAPSKAKGLTQQFTATATYEDASTADVTSSVTWASSSAHVSISAAGLATAASVGTGDITASLDGVTSPADTMTVTAAALVSIAVTPAAPTLVNGTSQQLTATGTYTDGTTANLTSVGTWASGTPSHVTVGAGTGLATAIASGTSVVGCTVSAVEGHTTVTAAKGAVVSLAVAPAGPQLYPGQTQQLVATATYEDESTADVTSSAEWSSSAASYASVDAAGLVTGIAGSANIQPVITASYTEAAATVTAATWVVCLMPVGSFFASHDVQNDAAWALVDFGLQACAVGLANLSGVEVQVSFDAVSTHGILDAASDTAGHAAALSFSFSVPRSRLYLKRTTGTGGGAKVVRVMASI